ncbi:hypothetical protein [Streptomyces sp. NPDC002845]
MRTEQPTASATKAPFVPLTTVQLKALMFKDGEVPQAREGGMGVQEPVSAEGDGSSFPPVSDPVCQTMLDVRSGVSASAVVSQLFNWEGDIYPGSSTVAAYEDGEALGAFTELKQALRTCRSYEGEGFVGEFTAAIKVEEAPEVGDEAVRFRELTRQL